MDGWILWLYYLDCDALGLPYPACWLVQTVWFLGSCWCYMIRFEHQAFLVVKSSMRSLKSSFLASRPSLESCAKLQSLSSELVESMKLIIIYMLLKDGLTETGQ
ncbi:hypothetical protein AMECASPLE_014804 [Ameca splendens]|uniref:Uncharacterized protein n=1 Tax=Ameca splendens TaxID=208324 RepID=A0ABV0ZLK4_9TELE